MSLNNIVFVDNLPKIDLHGYDRDTARVLINDFIEENYKMKQNVFSIVHGIGSGILKNTTFEVLKNNKKVIDYKTNYYNSGMTIVEIKI